MKILILIGIIASLTLSCASVRVELEPDSGQSTSFTHYSHYGLFGLLGSDSINVKKACMDGKAIKVKNYFSFEDMLFPITIATAIYSLHWVFLGGFGWFWDPLIILSSLGLYSPKSTKIWCELPNQDNSLKL